MLFALVVYPILKVAEHIKGYSKLVTERRNGDLKNSLLIVFFMFALVISICYGIFESKTLVIASIYAWGFGDAFAALIGKKFGKHKIHKKKSLEGTFAMFIVSFLTLLIIFLSTGMLSVFGVIFTSLIVSIIVSFVELMTPNGYDTITCPICAMVTIISLFYIFGGLV